MNKYLARFSLAALFAAFAIGCTSHDTTTVGLKIALTGIVSDEAGAAQVTWRLVNPNVVPYLVDETTQQIFIDGVLVGTTKTREPLAVPAHSQVNRTSPLVPAGAAAKRTLAAAAAAGSAAYRVNLAIVIRLYGDTTDKSTLTGSGTVPVTTK